MSGSAAPESPPPAKPKAQDGQGPSGPGRSPGPPPEQIQATVRWVTESLRAFYRANPPEMPPRFGRREFGFLPAPRPPPDRTPFFRHMGMRGREDLHGYLVHNAPWHCYYSTAYYADPNQSTMKEKGWLGADLIFDLDADHLPGGDTMTFPEQLTEVRRQARKLLEEFVLGDLGFDADHVRVVFSGGRGFHIHVDDPRVLTMDSAARREVVDYVTGRGVEVDGLVKERTAAVGKGFQGRLAKETYLLFPKASDPGWAGRYSRGVVRVLEEMAALGDARSVVKYARERNLSGIGEKTAAELIAIAEQPDASGKTQIQLLAEEGKTNSPVLKKLVRLQDLAVVGVNEEKGESDEPVTADIKRLIRLPGSIHGKTGLRVTPIGVDGLKDFEPLEEAVAFGENLVRVVVSKPEPIRLAGVDYSCEPGPQELPARYALFLAMRRKALVAI